MCHDFFVEITQKILLLLCDSFLCYSIYTVHAYGKGKLVSGGAEEEKERVSEIVVGSEEKGRKGVPIAQRQKGNLFLT